MPLPNTYSTLLQRAASKRPGSAEERPKAIAIRGYLGSHAEFSGAVMVREGREILIRDGFGFANVELQVPNTPETKYRIGSITKQFTAMIVMILVEEGKLSLEDRLVDRVPDVPAQWSRIRIHHLLNFTSGLMHSWDIPGFPEKIMVPYPLGAMIEEVSSMPLLFAPGEGCHYSGLGYFLLARIIEGVAGRGLESVLKAKIFEPLGMDASGADSQAAIIQGRAAGYVRVGGMLQNAPAIHMENLNGGGNLYSTVDDLACWDCALNAGSFVSADAYSAMYSPGRDAYGYGWKVLQASDPMILGSGGGVNGFRAYIRRVPEREICIVILSNDEGTAENLKGMAATIHELLEAPSA